MMPSKSKNTDRSRFIVQARTMSQRLFHPHSDDQNDEEAEHQNQPEDSTKPFRLLDLPKEIRLMIYEELDVVYKRHSVPLALGGGGHYGTLINPSLEGVRIMQTCRTINAESSYILQPALNHLSAKPATLQVRPEDLVALTAMGDFNTLHRNLLERILSIVRSGRAWSAIDAYRTGRSQIAELRRALSLPKDLDDELVKAIGTFILRAKAYKKHVPESPPIRVVIEMPASFPIAFYTVTTSRLRQSWCKYVRGETLLRSRTVRTNRRDILQSFAHRTSYSASSVAVLLHFPSPPDMYWYGLTALQHISESYIMRGIAAAKLHEENPALEYGGVCDPSEL